MKLWIHAYGAVWVRFDNDIEWLSEVISVKKVTR